MYQEGAQGDPDKGRFSMVTISIATQVVYRNTLAVTSRGQICMLTVRIVTC